MHGKLTLQQIDSPLYLLSSPSHHVDLEIDRGLICQHLVRVPVMGMQAEPTWCIHQQSTESVTRKV